MSDRAHNPQGLTGSTDERFALVRGLEGSRNDVMAAGAPTPERPDNARVENLKGDPAFNTGWRAAIPGLAVLSDAEADPIERCARHMFWPSGACVFEVGEAAADLRFLVSGTLRVECGSRTARFNGSDGQQCAVFESYLIADAGESATGWAETNVEAIVVPRQVVADVLEASPSFRARIFKTCADRIAEKHILVEEMSATDLEPRLARALVQSQNDGGDIELSVQAFSVLLGSQQSSVHSLLAEFDCRGWISFRSGATKVLDASALERAGR